MSLLNLHPDQLDKGGDENYRIYAVDPKALGDPIPPARDITPLEKVRAGVIAVPRDTPNEIIVGLNDRNPQLHDVYKINLTTGERTLIRQNNENIADWITDQKGNLRLGMRQTPDGGTEILKVGGENLIPIYSVNAEESVSPVHFMSYRGPMIQGLKKQRLIKLLLPYVNWGVMLNTWLLLMRGMVLPAN